MEEWRKVPGYEDVIYEISIATKEGKCRRIYPNGKIVELSTTPGRKDGRIVWSLCKNGGQKSLQAARWIAFTYPELVQNEYFEGAQIDHIDTDRLNNHPSNLRWVTAKENSNNPLTIRHLSEGLSGKNNPQYGKPVSSDTKKKISEAMKGHQVSESTRRKISQTLKKGAL